MSIHTLKPRGPITAKRTSPPNPRDDGDMTPTVSYVVFQYEVGGIEKPIASHDTLESCEAHIVRLTRDACDVRVSDRLFYSWTAVERYPQP